jgi:hypothetical protein
MVADGERTRQHIVRAEAGGDGGGHALDEIPIRRLRRDKDLDRVDPLPGRIAAVDAIQEVEMDRFGSDRSGGTFVFGAAGADRLFGGGESPLEMKRLREGAWFGDRRETATDRPDLHGGSAAGLVGNETARRKYNVIEVRGNVYPSHKTILPEKKNVSRLQ